MSDSESSNSEFEREAALLAKLKQEEAVANGDEGKKDERPKKKHILDAVRAFCRNANLAKPFCCRRFEHTTTSLCIFALI
jgi:hypothetical protein